MKPTEGTAKDVAYWKQLADYDLQTPAAMFRSRRYVYVLFTCQQAIEKILKALAVRATGTFPPKTHDLLDLADAAHLCLSSTRGDFLARLGESYIETRYPREVAAVGRAVSRKTANEYLQQTREMFQWLEGQLS